MPDVKWKPIKTAPRHQWVMVCGHNSHRDKLDVVFAVYVMNVDTETFWWTTDHKSELFPTHWMPIPEAHK